MPVVHTETDIDAPIEAVWQLLTDFERYSEWHPTIVRIEANGAIQDGANATIIIPLKKGAKPTAVPIVFADTNAPRSLCWRGAGMPKWLVNGYHYHQLKALPGGGTRLIQGERFGGVAFNLLWPFIRKHFQQNYLQIERNIKQRCESLVQG